MFAKKKKESEAQRQHKEFLERQDFLKQQAAAQEAQAREAKRLAALEAAREAKRKKS